MSNINLAQSMQSLETGRQISAYTGVVIHAGQDGSGNEITYSAGNTTGYVLDIDNPIGTQQMADTIYAGLKLRGTVYNPYTAGRAPIDPSAEIGDGVTVNGTDSTILSLDTNFSHAMNADVAAPFDEEIAHEFDYESKTTREFRRESAYVRSRLTITASSIEAKVDRTGGNASSFGWVLTDSDWSLYSNNSRVFRATADGVEVTGKITATSGVIGGVTIQNGTLSGITDTNIATGGISGGSGGSIAAGSLTGRDIASNTITGGTSGNIVAQTIENYNLPTATVSGIGYGTAYGLATTQGTSTYPSYFRCGALTVGTVSVTNLLSVNSLSLDSHNHYNGTITINGTSYNVVRWN